MKKCFISLCLASLLFVTMFSVTLLSAHTASAHAATVSCSSAPSFQNCDGVYPESDICPADAQTIASQNIVNSSGSVIGTVVVRYSNKCQSAWGKLTSTTASSLYLALYRNGTFFSAASTNTTGTSIRTVMAYAVFQAMRACGTINGYQACTA